MAKKPAASKTPAAKKAAVGMEKLVEAMSPAPAPKAPAPPPPPPPPVAPPVAPPPPPAPPVAAAPATTYKFEEFDPKWIGKRVDPCQYCGTKVKLTHSTEAPVALDAPEVKKVEGYYSLMLGLLALVICPKCFDAQKHIW